MVKQMGKMEAILAALLAHVPGLLFMNQVDVSWPVVLMAVLAVGIVFGLISSNRTSGFQWVRFVYEPVTILDLRLARKKDHELTGA